MVYQSEKATKVELYNKIQKENSTKKAIRKITKLVKAVTLEPLVVGYVTTKMMCEPAFKNLELQKSCKISSQFNDSVCKDIISGLYEKSNLTLENNVVQSHITQMHSWQLMVSNILTIILILLIGSYSDKYKIRKLFILTALFGQLVSLAGSILCVHFMNQWSLEVLGFCQEIIFALFGGDKLLGMLFYAYVTDISTPEMRTIRVAIIQALYNICCSIGQTLSGTLLQKEEYMLIFSSGFALCTLSFLYGIFIMKDSRPAERDEDNKKILLDICNPQHITRTFKMLGGYKGTHLIDIVCLLVVHLIYSIVYTGESSVLFLFTQAAYQWTISYYSFYWAVVTTINSFTLFFIVPFCTRVLRLNDLTIIIVSLLNKVVANVIIGTVKNVMGLYIGTAFAILKTLAFAGIRSQLTKYVSQDDVGKMLSICVVIDSFSEGVASLIYNKGIYEHTRTIFPQAFFLLAVALYSIGIVILMWVSFMKRNTTDEVQQSVKTTLQAETNDNAKEKECTHL